MRIAQKALLKIINLCAKIILFDKILDNKTDNGFNGLNIRYTMQVILCGQILTCLILQAQL